jgi:hypothetical protein
MKAFSNSCKLKSLALVAALFSCNIALAGNDTIKDPVKHGEQAHNIHCYKCHTDSVYIRDDRFVKSIDALSKQVVRCKDSNDVPWFDEETDAVVQFLNNKYYRF